MLPLLVLAAVAALLLSPGLWIGPSLDAAVFVTAAEAVVQGQTLYVDIWDHKPPGIHILFAAADLLLPGDAWVAAWAVSVVSLAAIGWVIAYGVTSAGHAPRTGWIVAALAVVLGGQYLLALGGGMTELPATAVAGAALVAGRDPRRLVPLLAGGLIGAAIIISLLAAPASVALVALVARQRRTLLPLVLLLMGVVGALSLSAGWLAIGGALDEAWNAVVGYAGPYRESNRVTGGYLSGPTISWTTLALLPLIVLAAYGAISAGLRRTLTAEHIGYLGWVAVAVAFFAYQGRFFAHYAITLTLPLAYLAALGVDRLAELLRARAGARRATLLVPIAVTAIISAGAGVVGGAMEASWWVMDISRTRATVSEVMAHSDAGDSILVWGNEPQLYADADRTPAIPYVFLYPLATEGYVTDGLVQALVDGLETSPPAVVVDAGSARPGEPGFLPLLVDRPIGNEGRTTDLLDPIRDFVRANYEEVTRDSGWIVYALRTGG